MSKNAVAFDFDGVIHKIKAGEPIQEPSGDPNMEVIETMYELNKMGIPVFILTSRAPNQVIEWFNDQGFKLKAKLIPKDTFFFNETDYVGVTNRKLPAQLYIDDRAYSYNGQSKKDLLMYIVKG